MTSTTKSSGPTEGPCRIVLVDPNPERMERLREGLGRFGYVTHVCEPGEWVTYVTTGSLTAVVLGPGLTPLEVWELCKEMRRHLDAPLLVFMDNDGVDCMALALDAGADACLPGKVDTAPRLILSAVAAIARREQLARRSSNGIVEAGHLRIDLYRKTVELHGELVPLTATEFGILSVLAQQPGCVISAGEIVRRVHGYEAVEGEAQDIVKVHISRLRQKLGEDHSSARCIANVRGQGYMYTFERRTEPRSIDSLVRENARETILATTLAPGAQ